MRRDPSLRPTRTITIHNLQHMHWQREGVLSKGQDHVPAVYDESRLGLGKSRVKASMPSAILGRGVEEGLASESCLQFRIWNAKLQA